MILEIQQEIKKREITRLCHFVHTNALLHIMEDGVKAVDFISKDVLAQNDTQRLDRKTDYINCSIQYPNWWYLRRVKNNNQVFPDWAILFIDPMIAALETTLFCKVNAAKQCGRYIKKGYNAFYELFEPQVGKQVRPSTMLLNAPTDDQAEVLVYKSIPTKYIQGIVFENEQIAREKIVGWRIMEYKPIDVLVAPELFDVSTSKAIRLGNEPSIKLFLEEKE